MFKYILQCQQSFDTLFKGLEVKYKDIVSGNPFKLQVGSYNKYFAVHGQIAIIIVIEQCTLLYQPTTDYRVCF